MSFALIHGLSGPADKTVPLFAQGVNTENSFFTDCPSITAVAGFVGMVSELDGLMSNGQKGRRRKGIEVKGFALIIHDYVRSEGKVAFNSGTINYVSSEDKLINAPVPLEQYTADMRFSIVIEYKGSLPDADSLDNALNARTRRFNGGTVLDDMMITDVDADSLKAYFRQFAGNQVLDRSDLGITTWDEMIEYMAFYENPETRKRDLRKHAGIYYAHQTGHQLLEEPCKRDGALLSGDDVCKHAYCEPVINLAELKHTTHFEEFSDLHLWQWRQDSEQRTVLLSTH